MPEANECASRDECDAPPRWPAPNGNEPTEAATVVAQFSSSFGRGKPPAISHAAEGDGGGHPVHHGARVAPLKLQEQVSHLACLPGGRCAGADRLIEAANLIELVTANDQAHFDHRPDGAAIEWCTRRRQRELGTVLVDDRDGAHTHGVLEVPERGEHPGWEPGGVVGKDEERIAIERNRRYAHVSTTCGPTGRPSQHNRRWPLTQWSERCLYRLLRPLRNDNDAVVGSQLVLHGRDEPLEWLDAAKRGDDESEFHGEPILYDECAPPSAEGPTPRMSHDENGLELTILMPCLNEAETLEVCITKALGYLQRSGLSGEVVVADNGSTDGSQEIARSLGARVVDVPEKGYGAALLGGIDSARGRYVIMGDADDSYDFSSLDAFVERLRAGDDLVMGNRFRGGIEPGAMPPLHKYLGNPVLSWIGRVLFRSPIKDFHCGLRGFNRDSMRALGLQTTGMEFASEMVVKSTLGGAGERSSDDPQEGRALPPPTPS